MLLRYHSITVANLIGESNSLSLDSSQRGALGLFPAAFRSCQQSGFFHPEGLQALISPLPLDLGLQKSCILDPFIPGATLQQVIPSGASTPIHSHSDQLSEYYCSSLDIQ